MATPSPVTAQRMDSPASEAVLPASFPSLPSCGAFAKLQLQHMRMQAGGVRLDWRDLRFAIGDKEILRDVTGMIEPGRLVGVMGPSGSGKTTLMNVLSGRQRRKGRSAANTQIGFSGEIRINGRRAKTSHIRGKVAYVFQDVALLETETPRECLNFSALLRLPRTFSQGQREAYVDGMLSCLGLEECADTCVGSALKKGLSGGEQKRVAIGVELISNPSVVFLDEPLSGLDAYNAYVVTRSMKTLASSGVAVLMTVHQPSSEIFAELDDVLVLHGGEVCFHGPRTSLTSHFDALGMRCPVNFNPSDYIMFTITSSAPERVASIKEAWRGSIAGAELLQRMSTAYSLDHSSDSEADDDDDSDDDDDESSLASDVDSDDVSKPVGGRHPTMTARRQRSFCRAFCALLHRDGRGIYRQRSEIITAHIVLCIVAILYGWFFYMNGVKEDSPSYVPNCLPDKWSAADCSAKFGAHIAIASLVSLNMMLVSLNIAIDILHKERAVLLREIASGYYSIFAFFASKSTYEVLLSSTNSLASLVGAYFLVGLRGNFFTLFASIELMALSSSSLMYCLSAGTPTREAAAGVAILPQVLQFAFSGLLVPTNLIPVSLQWLKWICPLYYGIGLVMETEFSYVFEEVAECQIQHRHNWTEHCPGVALKFKTLHLHDAPEGGMKKDALMLVLLLVVYRSIAVLILWRKTRFAV